MGYRMISFEFLRMILPALLSGAGVTLALAVCSAVIGISGGTALALAQTSTQPLLYYIVASLVTAVRGTPMLLQIIFLDLILLPQLGIRVSSFVSAVIAIGINSSAYVSQIIRSGINAVPSGQIEAAQTLGVSKTDLMRFIVLPQAFTTIAPALGNELVTLIKDSSLASLIGVMELYQRGYIIMTQTHQALPVYLATGFIYLCMTTVTSFIMHKLEQYMRYARD
jgi:His/Glu/Gln/Arg/opine family amino acid ABC transporter permease subunit